MPLFNPPGGGGAVATAPNMRHTTFFENSGRFTTNVTGVGTVAWGSNGVVLHTNGGNGLAAVFDNSSQPGGAVFDWNPQFWFDAMLFKGGATNASTAYVLFNDATAGGSALPSGSASYFGFKCVVSSNGNSFTLSAVTNDGTGEVAVAITGVDFTASTTFLAKYTSGSKVEFYVNHTLVATITTGLPTGFTNGIFSAIAKNSSSNSSDVQLSLARLGYQWDAVAS